MNVEELIELTCEVQAGGGGASDARAEEGEEQGKRKVTSLRLK